MNIHTIDLHHCNTAHTIASFLVVGPGGPVLVETGPGSALQKLLAGLRQHGYEPADIRHVLVTHIHLDHAGNAGWWARQGAQVYVHHVGAPHLIDPSKLLASARRIYGDEMDELWGEMLPVPQERITVLYDGDEVNVCGLRFVALDTPGHARHHHVFRLEEVAFAGDAAGVRMPDTSLISLPAPPPEFDLEAWHTTIARLLGEKFTAIYPTHFGRVSDVQEHLEALTSLLSQAAEYIRDRMQAGMERDDIVREYVAWNRALAKEHDVSDAVVRQFEIASGHWASVDGIMRYWRKRRERENQG